MKSIIKDAIILFAITLIAGVLLGLVHDVTLEPIKNAQASAANNTYKTVFPDAETFENNNQLTQKAIACSEDSTIQEFGSNVNVIDVMLAKGADGSELGYVIISEAKGYGGPVKIAVGIDNDGVLTGVGCLAINETPGLGMRAKEADFLDQFVGMSDISEMSAITGASYTSKAFRGAIKAAEYCYENYI